MLNKKCSGKSEGSSKITEKTYIYTYDYIPNIYIYMNHVYIYIYIYFGTPETLSYLPWMKSCLL